jgi:DNA-binding transcriptional LysR family regulator
VRITLAHLEAFVWIARLGSVKETARQLNLAQPTISLRLRDLEEETRSVLFARNGGMRLTHEGEALLGHATAILGEVARIRERLVSETVEGLARIGLAETFALVCLPGLVRQLAADYPSLRLELVVATSSDLEPELLEGRLDLAFLIDPSHDPRLRLIPLGAQSATWAASPSLGLPPTVRPADLRAVPIITTPHPSAMYRQVMNWFRDADVEPIRIDLCTSVSVITQLVSDGVAAAYLPQKMIEAPLRSGILEALAARPEMEPPRLYAGYRAADTSPATGAVIRVARQVVAETDYLKPLSG